MRLASFYQLGGIILCTLGFRIIKEEFISFDSPICWFGWIGHWSKNWNWFVASSLQSRDKSSVSSHTEASNWDVLSANREVEWNKVRKLLSNVWEHSEVFLGYFWSGVYVVACWISKLPITVNTSDSGFSGTCVWEDAGDAMLSGIGSESRFDGKILVIGSQTTKAIKGGERLSSWIFDFVFRKINSKGHFSLHLFTPVTYGLQQTSVVFNRWDDFYLWVDCFWDWGRRDFDDSSQRLTFVKNINGFVDFLEAIKLMSNIVSNRPLSS